MRAHQLLLWLARVLSIASTLLLAAFAFGGQETALPRPAEIVGLLLFPVGVVIGFAVAWWRAGLGGLISVASLALFYLWMFNRDGRLPTGPYFFLFASPAFVFLASALLNSGKAQGIAAGLPR